MLRCIFGVFWLTNLRCCFQGWILCCVVLQETQKINHCHNVVFCVRTYRIKAYVDLEHSHTLINKKKIKNKKKSAPHRIPYFRR